MEKYYITNCKSIYRAENIEVSFPKEAFLTVVNYNKADEEHGIFLKLYKIYHCKRGK